MLERGKVGQNRIPAVPLKTEYTSRSLSSSLNSSAGSPRELCCSAFDQKSTLCNILNELKAMQQKHLTTLFN